MEKRVLLVPVDLLGLVVLQEIQVSPVFLDPLVLLVVLAGRESASRAAKEKKDSLEFKVPKVMRSLVLLDSAAEILLNVLG